MLTIKIVKHGKTLEEENGVPVCLGNYSMCWCDDYCTEVEECVQKQKENNTKWERNK